MELRLGLCIGEVPGRDALTRRARERGCTLFHPPGPGYECVRYGLLDQTEGNAAVARIVKERRAVIATHVLAGGLLSGGDPRVRPFEFLIRPGRTLVQAAIQFVLANESVSAAIVRVSSLEHLEEVLSAPDAPPLTGRDLEGIFEAYAHRFD